MRAFGAGGGAASSPSSTSSLNLMASTAPSPAPATAGSGRSRRGGGAGAGAGSGLRESLLQDHVSDHEAGHHSARRFTQAIPSSVRTASVQQRVLCANLTGFCLGILCALNYKQDVETILLPRQQSSKVRLRRSHSIEQMHDHMQQASQFNSFDFEPCANEVGEPLRLTVRGTMACSIRSSMRVSFIVCARSTAVSLHRRVEQPSSGPLSCAGFSRFL